MDDGTEVRGLCITRTTDIEFLLNEILGLERNLGLGIADADDTASESNFIDSHLISGRAAHSLDDHIGTESGSHLQQTGMYILCLRVDGVAGSHLLG